MILPSFITKIKFAFLIVDSLCAIIKDVLPSVNLSIAFCTNSSVLVSTLEVASSKIKNGASSNIPLAIVKSCL